MSDTERIEEIKARLQAATPGPWEYQERSDAYTHIVRTPPSRFLCQLSQDTSGVTEANARLIASAPSDISWLLSRLEDAERRVSETERDARRLDFLEAMAMHATMNDFESGAVCEYVTENDDEPVEWDWEVPGASITQGELPLFHGKTLRASNDAAIAGTPKSGWVDGLLRDRDNYAAEFVARVGGQDGGTEG
jgi:hypothetical protein